MKKLVRSRIVMVMLCLVMLASLVLPAAAATNSGALKGHWESVKLKDGSSRLTVSAFVLDTALEDCTAIDVAMDVEMNGNTSCKDWQMWIRTNGKFVKSQKIYLAAGNGYTSTTVRFPKAVSFDAVVLTPTKVGGYSWSLGMELKNPVCAGQIVGSDWDDSDDADDEDIDLLFGTWESVKLKDGSKVYTISAFVPEEKVVDCTSFELLVDVTMNGKATCKEWQVWVRSNGKFEKASTFTIEGGDGIGFGTVTFSKAKSFDAIAVTPVKMGSYSWSLDMFVYNVVTK